MADAFIHGDDGEWVYIGRAVVNPCARPDCDKPSAWTFQASGDEGVFEVVAGLLIEAGDTVRLCDTHALELREECLAREDCKPWTP